MKISSPRRWSILGRRPPDGDFLQRQRIKSTCLKKNNRRKGPIGNEKGNAYVHSRVRSRRRLFKGKWALEKVDKSVPKASPMHTLSSSFSRTQALRLLLPSGHLRIFSKSSFLVMNHKIHASIHRLKKLNQNLPTC